MADKPENQPAETEKGFGTGLRAQLERRRGDEDKAVEPQGPTNVELRFELTARPAGGDAETVAISSPDLTELKSELEAAQRREAALRSRLDQQSAAYDGGMTFEKELANRAANLDAREAKLAEFEVDLEERERKVRDQKEVIEGEHARVADLQAELAAEQQHAAEQLEQAEARMQGLQNADREREKATSDLAKQLSGLAQREKKLERKETELDTRHRPAEARPPGRARQPQR